MNTTRFVRCSLLLPVVLAAAALSGCAAQITHEQMTPVALDVARKHPQSVTVVALPKPGADPAAAAADLAKLRAALDDSIRGYKVFSSVKPAGGDYQLTVQVLAVDTPMFAISFTSGVELDWTLRRAGGAVVWQEKIRSEYTTGGDEAFVGAERQTMSIAGAFRKNIGAGLQKIGTLPL
jgi:hypothetical protein